MLAAGIMGIWWSIFHGLCSLEFKMKKVNYSPYTAISVVDSLYASPIAFLNVLCKLFIARHPLRTVFSSGKPCGSAYFVYCTLPISGWYDPLIYIHFKQLVLIHKNCFRCSSLRYMYVKLNQSARNNPISLLTPPPTTHLKSLFKKFIIASWKADPFLGSAIKLWRILTRRLYCCGWLWGCLLLFLFASSLNWIT